MKATFMLLLFFSTTALATYRTYDPYNDRKYINDAITGKCRSEHQRYDDLDFELKSSLSGLSNSEADNALADLNVATRNRWECIERELNKRNITLDLEKLYKENGL
ncbi:MULTISPECIES: hypothetical protein [Aeromonas]|uniref:hypothetical protein n=1 Tax=Aeromonas TaxID=642 RepID=UPI001C24AA86|nr:MULTISPECIES: hypothetical protein [Aeromonas]QWZ85431.1 hypothetical protein I6L34_00445 [Aeromonas sp. FDAARGOS 1404]